MATTTNLRTAQYLQHWTIDGHRDEWGWTQREEDSSEHESYSDADTALLEKMFRKPVHLERWEQEICIRIMRGGAEQGLIAFTPALFPNLTSLDFKDQEGIYDEMTDLTLSIANGGAKNSAGVVPLSSLERVNIGAILSSDGELSWTY